MALASEPPSLIERVMSAWNVPLFLRPTLGLCRALASPRRSPSCRYGSSACSRLRGAGVVVGQAPYLPRLFRALAWPWRLRSCRYRFRACSCACVAPGTSAPGTDLSGAELGGRDCSPRQPLHYKRCRRGHLRQSNVLAL